LYNSEYYGTCYICPLEELGLLGIMVEEVELILKEG